MVEIIPTVFCRQKLNKGGIRFTVLHAVSAFPIQQQGFRGDIIHHILNFLQQRAEDF